MRRLAALLALAALAGCSRPATQAVTLATPAAALTAESCDPALATEPEGGDLLLAWMGGDSVAWRLWFARSADDGRTWSTPVAVTPPGEPLHPHAEASPRLLAATGGRIALVWSVSREVEGREWPASDVRFARSRDGGRSWSAPVTLNDDTTAAPSGHTFHGATLVGDSALAVAWLDERPVPGTDSLEGHDNASIYLARSSDFGGAWSANRVGWGAVCPCCRVALAGQPDGGAVAVWRRHFPGQVRDVVMASLDGTPRRVHADDWRFEGCPHTGPAVRVSGDGRAHVAWYTGAPGRAGVWYLADATAAPTPIVAGERVPVAHVSLALAGGAAVVACDVDSTGGRAVTLARLGPDGRVVRITRVPGSDDGSHPQVVATSGGRATVVWTAAGGRAREVAMASVEL